MKRFTRYDFLILLFLSLLAISLISRSSTLSQKEELTEEYTLLVEFSGKMPEADIPLFLYGHPLGTLRPIGGKRAYLSVRGIRLANGFFMEGERWIGANLPLSIVGGERVYEALVLSLFGS